MITAMKANGILIPRPAFKIRFNCAVGKIALSENHFLGDTAEVFLIKVNHFFGSIGRTPNTNWLQVWMLGHKGLPPRVVTVGYLKTRSISNLQNSLILASVNGNPAEKIWQVSFTSHSNDRGKYYSVEWKTRDPVESENEILELIAQINPDELSDPETEEKLINTENLNAQQLRTLQSAIGSQLNHQEIIALLAP